jgi:sugar phosphate isomerase/epimerase
MKTMQSRRNFLQVSAAGALGAAALSSFACKPAAVPAPEATGPVADPKSFNIGLQLYTVRANIEKDLVLTLKEVNKIGYKYIELANYANGKFYGLSPEEFKKIVDDIGLEILSSHTQVEGKGITLDNAKLMAESHAKVGAKYCVQPWINAEDRTIDKFHKMVADWNKVGEIMKENGIKFGYHNHNFEFKNMDGVVPYFDIYMKEMDKDLITMEIDLFWATKAGIDIVDMFNKYPGRFELFHMKDGYTTEAPFFEPVSVDFAPVGTGLVNFKDILAAKDVAGMKYMIVEQDCTFTDVRTSMQNLTTKILV